MRKNFILYISKIKTNVYNKVRSISVKISNLFDFCKGAKIRFYIMYQIYPSEIVKWRILSRASLHFTGRDYVSRQMNLKEKIMNQFGEKLFKMYE